MTQMTKFDPVKVENGTFKQQIALLAALSKGKIGFDPYRGPKDWVGPWNKDAMQLYLQRKWTAEERTAAWARFTGEATVAGSASGWTSQAISLDEFDAPAQPVQSTHEAPAAQEVAIATNPHPAGSMEARIWEIAREAAATVAGPLDAAAIAAIAREAVAQTSQPTIVHLVTPEGDTVNVGVSHKAFPQLVRALDARDASGKPLNVWLAGPPGTGKSYGPAQYARARNIAFGESGPLGTKYDVLGFNSADGTFAETEFFRICQSPGVFLFDEIRASVPSALPAIFGMLANRRAPFACGTVEFHAEFRIIVADNLRPGQVSAQFSGGFKQDEALISRFAVINWEIDEALESRMASGPQADKWVSTVRRFRSQAAQSGASLINVTPRAVASGSALLNAGFSIHEAAEMVIRGGMSDAAWQPLAAACLVG